MERHTRWITRALDAAPAEPKRIAKVFYNGRFMRVCFNGKTYVIENAKAAKEGKN